MKQLSFSIPANTIKGLLLVAAKKDVRYYLNGVCFEVRAGNVRALATDGCKMVAVQIMGTGVIDCPDSEVIIKRDFLEYILKTLPHKGCEVFINLSFDDKGKASININGTTSEPVDGRFPDWRRIVANSKYNEGGQWASFTIDGDQLAPLQKAVALITNTKKLHLMKQTQGGCIHMPFDYGLALVMPVSESHCLTADNFVIG